MIPILGTDEFRRLPTWFRVAFTFALMCSALIAFGMIAGLVTLWLWLAANI